MSEIWSKGALDYQDSMNEVPPPLRFLLNPAPQQSQGPNIPRRSLRSMLETDLQGVAVMRPLTQHIASLVALRAGTDAATGGDGGDKGLTALDVASGCGEPALSIAKAGGVGSCRWRVGAGIRSHTPLHSIFPAQHFTQPPYDSGNECFQIAAACCNRHCRPSMSRRRISRPAWLLLQERVQPKQASSTLGWLSALLFRACHAFASAAHLAERDPGLCRTDWLLQPLLKAALILFIHAPRMHRTRVLLDSLR